MEKVYLLFAIINNSDKFEIIRKGFLDPHKAAHCLHEEYLDIKLKDSVNGINNYDIDNVVNTIEDDNNDYYESTEFFLGNTEVDYWSFGYVEELKIISND